MNESRVFQLCQGSDREEPRLIINRALALAYSNILQT
jgi:hypothetical protein